MLDHNPFHKRTFAHQIDRIFYTQHTVPRSIIGTGIKPACAIVQILRRINQQRLDRGWQRIAHPRKLVSKILQQQRDGTCGGRCRGRGLGKPTVIVVVGIARPTRVIVRAAIALLIGRGDRFTHTVGLNRQVKKIDLVKPNQVADVLSIFVNAVVVTGGDNVGLKPAVLYRPPTAVVRDHVVKRVDGTDGDDIFSRLWRID